MTDDDRCTTAPALLQSLVPLYPPIAASIANLAALIPSTQFYRYNDMFSRSLQSAAFIVVFKHFLETEDVASKTQVEEVLGSKSLLSDLSLNLPVPRSSPSP
jgi:hypothetical protein